MGSDRHPEPNAPLHGERFLDPRRLARSLYWRGWGVTELVDELNKLHGLGLKTNTVQSWKTRDAWDDAPMIERAEDCTVARYCMLVCKETKTGSDYKEIDLLGRQVERMARVRRSLQPGGHSGDINPKIANRNAGEKKQARKNHLTADQVAEIKAAFESGLFDYQLAWRAPLAGVDVAAGNVVPLRQDLVTSSANVTRFILKSRQIGATFYFAREAFIRLLETGNNQIFISASRAQANIFRQYIVDFVMAVTGVKLEGDPITMDLVWDDGPGITGPNDESPKLYFLGTNYRTAQGYHGDVYVDECFWVHGFDRIDDVASAMATQARYRITYFSTPSTVAHDAHRTWNGEKFNEGREKSERGNFKFSDDELRAGVLGADDIWRQRVTILDAIAGGCDLINLDRQRKRYAPDVFDQLYMCQFIDDSQSMFPFNLMRRAMCDSWDEWAKDFQPYAMRPFGERPVWVGVDPAESAAGDAAAVVVIAPPEVPGGKFRVLEKYRHTGYDFQRLAAFVLALRDRYNVEHIAIDTTGMGSATWKLVVAEFPMARRIDYNIAVKTEMVLKAKNVFSAGRIQFDNGAIDIAHSFMAIRAELTGSQKQITYTASRAGDTGHADLAWAIMHVLHNEPLDPEQAGVRKSRMRIYGNGPAKNDRRDSGDTRAERRDRRDVVTRHRDGAGTQSRLPLRRARGSARSPRVPQSYGGTMERQVVRAAYIARRARKDAPYVAASFERDQIQGQPADALLRALAVA